MYPILAKSGEIIKAGIISADYNGFFLNLQGLDRLPHQKDVNNVVHMPVIMIQELNIWIGWFCLKAM